MQFVVETLESENGLVRKMRVNLSGNDFQAKVDKRLNEVSRTARVDGFRAGKVPMQIVRQRYSAQVRQEVGEKMFDETYSKALDEAGLRPAGYPRVTLTPPTKAGEDFSYEAILEIFPDVTVQGLDQIQIKRPVADVTETDTAELLLQMRKQQRTFAPAPADHVSAQGDCVVADFDGTLDGEALPSGKQEGMRVILGETNIMPELLAAITGQTAGSTSHAAITYPENYQNQDLANKTAEFTINIKEIEISVLPEVNEAFAKTLGVEGGADALNQKVFDTLVRQRDQFVHAEVKEQVMNGLLAQNSPALPNTLLAQDCDQLRWNAAQRIAQNDRKQAEKFYPMLKREMFLEQAKRRVALGLLINGLIKQNQLVADPARLETLIDTIAADYEEPAEMRNAILQNKEQMDHLRSIALEDTVVALVAEQAQLSDEPVAFAELRARVQARTENGGIMGDSGDGVDDSLPPDDDQTGFVDVPHVHGPDCDHEH